jgi:hypothetical protein
MNEPPPRPLGLSLLTWLMAFWAGASVLLILFLVLGDGPIPLSGRAVSRQEAIARIIPIFGPVALAAAGAALALALDKPWARSALLLPFALVAMAPAFTGVAATARDLALGILALVPAIALIAWYLYFRPGVAAYFDWLRERERIRSGGSLPGEGRGPRS